VINGSFGAIYHLTREIGVRQDSIAKATAARRKKPSARRCQRAILGGYGKEGLSLRASRPGSMSWD
jgi:hypothetical protein